MTTPSGAQPSAALGTPPGDALLGLSALGKLGFALLAVISLILLCAWLLRRLNRGGLHPEAQLRVLGSTPLGPRERLVVIEMQGTRLLLGVTASQISKLHELRAPPTPENDSQPPAVPEQGSFASRFALALRHNLRRPPS